MPQLPIPSSGFVVTIKRDGRVVSSVRFDQTEVSIGRSPSSDVVLDDAQVSWHHAVVRLDRAAGIVFLDRSSNGSFRKGERISEAVLGSGDTVSVPPYDIDLVRQHTDADADREEPYVRTRVRGSRTPPGTRRGHVRDTGEAAPPSPPPATEVDLEETAELRIIQAPDSHLGEIYPLEARSMVVGRAPDCDIRLRPRSISRYHARIAPAGPSRWKVADAGSQNGLEVNGQIVREAVVGFGDRIGFGTEIVAVLEAGPVRMAPAALAADSEHPPPTALDAVVVRHAASQFNPGVTVIRIVGRIDGYSYSLLRDEIGLLMDNGSRFLVADLTQCSYCDHTGLGVLVNVHVTLRQRRGGLVLIGVSDQLRDAFLLLRLDHILSTAPDEQTAANELAKLIK